MTQRIPEPPIKRIKTETPIIVENPNDPQAEQRARHKKMERMADRAAHRATDTEKLYDTNHPTISGSN
ncbi:MAG TPA: hypothetical protein VMU71_03995 [Terracidiphilus sp.]|nr:hypothetical protein [Terracidiphilus sp.]